MAVEFAFKSKGDTDKATRQNLNRLADKLGKGSLKVGFLEGASYPDGTSVAQVAFWNEFGTKRAPARPFFRTTIAREQKTWGEKIGKSLAYHKGDAEAALTDLGASMADDLKVSIQRWTTPPNAASTIKRKGFNKPLIDKSVMVKAPDFVVTK